MSLARRFTSTAVGGDDWPFRIPVLVVDEATSPVVETITPAKKLSTVDKLSNGIPAASALPLTRNQTFISGSFLRRALFDCVFFESFEVDVFERAHVGCGEIDCWCATGFVGFFPAGNTQTPTVARF